jgi:hypothetical protein
MPVTINGNALADSGTQYLTSLTAVPTQSTISGLGNHFTQSVAASSIAVLLLRPRLPGDFNDDGIVDAADYTVWRDTLGQTGQDLAADFTGPGGTPDGVVDSLDYDFWVANFGATAPGSGASSLTTVPEPSSLVLITMAFFAVGFCRRSRTRQAANRLMPLRRIIHASDPLRADCRFT